MTEEMNRNNDPESEEKASMESLQEIEVVPQIENVPEAEESSQRVCKQCGSPDIAEGYLIDLCKDCRDKASRFNLPLWVKGFTVFVAAVLIFALIRFPNSLNAGVAYEKAVKYEHNKMYMSAMKEYEKVVAVYPNSITALSKLFIAQFKMGRVGDAADTYSKIAGKTVDDDQLFNDVDSNFQQMDVWYYPTEKYDKVLDDIKNVSSEEARDKVAEYIAANPGELFPKIDYAYILCDTGELEKAKEVAQGILKENPDNVDAYFLLGYIYRDTKEYDKAIELYKKILESNIERADAYSAIARIELKRGNDKEGLDMALKAYNIDNTDPYIVSNVVLAYHFNKMTAERDKVFEEFKKIKNYNKYDMELLNGIISGTNNEWRD